MHEVSLFRLYVLRAMYMFIVTGRGVPLWPARMIQNRISWRVLRKHLWAAVDCRQLSTRRELCAKHL